MAFNFGGIGSQPANTSLNFGAGANQPKPAFGAPATAGFSFGGGAQNQSNFSFGSSFGQPTATSAAPGFSTLGAPTNTAGGFGGFGTTATSIAPQANTSFGFGATATTASTGFNFGAPTGTTAQTGFGGFGTLTSQAQPGTNTGFGSFGTASTAGQTGLFGGLGTTTTAGTSTFGTQQAGQSSLFGAKPTNSFNFGGGGLLGGSTNFGTGASNFGTGTGSVFGTGTFGSTLGQTSFQQPQQQQQPAPDPNQLIANAVLNVKIFGDERDTILAKWNLLQASWGIGKGYYSSNQPPVEFKPENPYCRFKSMAYNAMPGKDNKEGQVILVFSNKKCAEVKAQLSQIQQTITSNIFGNKPELKLCMDDAKAIKDDCCQISFSVEEKNSLGTTRKIPATDLSNYLNQNVQKQQLANMGITKIFPNVKPDSEQLQEYLKNPPSGIDPRIWKQAQEDNPNPDKFLPIPIIGFNQLKWRLQIQEEETALHRAYLDQVMDDITTLKQKQTAAIARIAEHKRKYLDLQHRVLKILVKQEMYRKVGMALQPEEEQLRIQLENMQAQISIPTQFRGRLTELLAHIRILKCGDEPITGTNTAERYTISSNVQDEIKQFLYLEQVGINHLIETINNDQATLHKIKEGITSILQP